MVFESTRSRMQLKDKLRDVQEAGLETLEAGQEAVSVKCTRLFRIQFDRVQEVYEAVPDAV